MNAYDKLIAERTAGRRRAVPALATIDIQPDEFCASWHNRPIEPITFGLRLLPERDVWTARSEAAERAVRAHPAEDVEHRVEAFNDTLLCIAVARCLCDPKNSAEPHPVLPFAEDQIPDAFTSQTIRRIWDAIERLAVEQSPLTPEASDGDLVALAAILTAGRHKNLAGADAARFRRYATYMLDVVAPETE